MSEQKKEPGIVEEMRFLLTGQPKSHDPHYYIVPRRKLDAIMAEITRLRAERPGWREDDVLRALCCPEGCLRPDDCWARKGPGRMFRLQQAKAVCALHPSVAEGRSDEKS